MSQNQRDAAPEGGNGKRAAKKVAAERISAARVIQYRERHPDFLCAHPEVLEVLTPPARINGNGVVDLQQFMVERLRDDLAKMAAARDAVVATGRSNLSAQGRVHQAVLAL